MIEVVLLAFIILAILFYAAYMILEMRSPSDNAQKYIDKPKSDFKSLYNVQAQKAYVLFLRIPILKKLVKTIRRKMETVASVDEYSLRREIMTTIFTITILCAVILTGFAVFAPDWNIMVWVLIGLAFLSSVLIDLFVYRVEERLLVQTKEYLGHLRYFYQQTKMVDESAYEAMQMSGPVMKKQADRMYEILLSHEPNKALQEYEDVAPNRFLKVIAGLLVLIKEQGDVETDKGSAFLRGLTSMTQELNDEILFRNKLRYKLKGLTVVAIIPMFFALPIKYWASTYFPSLGAFYDSWFGVFSQIIVYASVFISFLLIRKMKEVTEPKYHATVKRNSWEERLLKYKPISKFINLLVPHYYQKTHYKLTKLIKEANSPMKIEWLYLQRVLLALLSAAFMISTTFIIHFNEKNDVLYKSTPASFYIGKQAEDDIARNEALTAFDREILLKTSEWKAPDQSDVQKLVATQMGLEKDDQEVETITKRIMIKFSKIENAFVKWWEVLLAMVVALFSYQLPVWILYFHRFMRKKEMENEVNQFYILIGVLREFDRMSVETILIWMERFSVVFREPLRECLQEFDSGPEETLKNMKDKVSFEPFNQIISRLELSVVRISIKQAFNDSEVERDYYIAQRKEINERSIEEKSWFGEVLGLAPVYILIGLYLIAPFLYISITESGDLLMQIQ
ncbi:hypothetical protein [Bacillus cihuensis]|uniref:hypothetical protein n=1 Tax=Bacillus cihuensis TaxID=1208599 RepID=UPI00041A162F|nr:hypothetical protein [Bacillus cihuensis]